MEILEIKIAELKPYKNNPRKNDGAVDSVAASIREFGFRVPIIVTADLEIIAGHTRLKAAKKLGMASVPCIKASDLSPEQIKAFRLADNKVSELAEWDFSALSLELEGIENIDMMQFGFESIESEADAVDDEFDDSVPENPFSQLGDVWMLGRHRIICGDATDAKTIDCLMNGVKADQLLTDPPYNVDYSGSAGKIQNDNMEDSKFREFLHDAFAEAKRAMRPGAAFYIWHADSEGYNFRGACKDVGFKVRQCLIWVKNSLVLGRQDYQWIHEPCLFGETEENDEEHAPCLYGWNTGAAHTWKSNRKQTTVLHFDRPTKSKDHPTMKPVPLFDYLIKNNTAAGDIVLDPFLGSGTTMSACEQNGRTCYGLELDPKYCDVIVRRYITLSGSTESVKVLRDGEMKVYDEIVV